MLEAKNREALEGFNLQRGTEGHHKREEVQGDIHN